MSLKNMDRGKLDTLYIVTIGFIHNDTLNRVTTLREVPLQYLIKTQIAAKSD